MKIRSVTVRMSRKQTRNYNSTEVAVEFAADLGPGDDAAAVKRLLGAQCVSAIREEFLAINQAALPAGG